MILGLLVANLLLLPVLLLPFSGGVVLLKPLLAVVNDMFFGIWGATWPKCTAAHCCAC